MHNRHFLMIVLLAAMVSGCSATVIQHPSLSGPWSVTVTKADIGRVALNMEFEAEAMQGADTVLFRAFTKKNADKAILGATKAMLGRLAGSGFKEGSLIRIVQGRVVQEDSLIGILASPFGNFHVRAALDSGRFTGVLKDGRNAIVGTIAGEKAPHRIPVRDYPAILDTALGIATRKLFDPALLQQAEWKTFAGEMRRVAGIAEDDAAFVMAFFYYARKLSFSHFALHIPAPGPADTSGPAEPARFAIETLADRTAYVRIPSFAGDASSMDRIFDDLARAPFNNLIIDLRDNPGGSVEAGMAFARHLIPDTIYCGAFLTQLYFRHHAQIPAPETFRSFPRFSEANYCLLMEGISAYPALCLVAYPATPTFSGRVYMLSNEGTASTCEPILYALKQHRLATIVGTRTAGAMLSSESFPVRDGYTLNVPTATYYAADGYKIDRQGVVPDIQVESGDALAYVLKLLAGNR